MSESSSLALVDSCMCTNLRKTSRLITRLYDVRLKPSGININQLALLLTIDGLRHGDAIPSLTEVGEAMAMDSSTLSRNLRVLENQGFIVLIPDTDNRTKKTVAITEEGNIALQQAFPLWMDIQQEVQEKMGKESFQELIDLLQKLETILRKF